MLNLITFGVFPYVALIIAVTVGLYRYFSNRFSYSSLSSQFLENRQIFWGSVPWHYSILLILFAHIIAAVFPEFWGKLLGEKARLYFLEISGIALGLLAICGIIVLIVRRISNPKLVVITSIMDWIVLVALLLQVISGVFIAFFYRWGGVWYTHTAAPWLASIVRLNPQIEYITSLPLIAKFHVFNAFLIIALYPFSRLVHILTFPLSYLWRPYQVVIWNRQR